MWPRLRKDSCHSLSRCAARCSSPLALLGQVTFPAPAAGCHAASVDRFGCAHAALASGSSERHHCVDRAVGTHVLWRLTSLANQGWPAGGFQACPGAREERCPMSERSTLIEGRGLSLADIRTPGWPDLTLSRWEATRKTLHLWTQVVGKVRLALEPMVNHWWQVPLYVSARGLTTSLMHAPGVDMEIEFDFVDHRLHMRTSTGEARQVALRPRSVADFYAETTSALDSLGVHVKMLAKPVEIPDAIPFANDDVHHSYDANAA